MDPTTVTELADFVEDSQRAMLANLARDLDAMGELRASKKVRDWAALHGLGPK